MGVLLLTIDAGSVNAGRVHVAPAPLLIVIGLAAIAVGLCWPLAMRRLHERLWGPAGWRGRLASLEQPVLRVRQYVGATIFVGGGLVALTAGVVRAF